jgi:8-oxo-dGTP diphosphatase
VRRWISQSPKAHPRLSQGNRPPCDGTGGAATLGPAARIEGGRVEHGEDPFDAVIREVAEETGCDAAVERLLGVDSRVVPETERRWRGPLPHHNVGIFYRVRITGGELRPEPDGDIAESVWTPIPDVARLRRSSLVDIGLALARSVPPTGHVPPVPVGGLIQH